MENNFTQKNPQYIYLDYKHLWFNPTSLNTAPLFLHGSYSLDTVLTNFSY